MLMRRPVQCLFKKTVHKMLLQYNTKLYTPKATTLRQQQYLQTL
jgi:hypothetical protein